MARSTPLPPNPADTPKRHLESMMMSHGYDPQTASGAIKTPLYATSTFAFPNAETGKERFAAAHGAEGAAPGAVYSRLGHPGLELAEERLRLWDDAEACAIFHSGMSAISTTLLAYLKPGDVLLFNGPLYGGTDHFIRHYLPELGVHAVEFGPNEPESAIKLRLHRNGLQKRVKMIFVETPANPTNELTDLAACRSLADQLSTAGQRVLLAVDNTFLGPMWQHPLQHGADLVIYSATKYIGGHSDLIAGAVSGSIAALQPIKTLRVYLGTAADAWVSWLLLRSLETLSVRMKRQAESAAVVADFLRQHEDVLQVRYLGFLSPADGSAYTTYRLQCEGPGAMISFYLQGAEEEAFRFLNALELIRLAVSLGGTESLAEHPATMTHSGVALEDRERLGIHPNLIRLSIGLEHPQDLIADLQLGFAAIMQPCEVAH